MWDRSAPRQRSVSASEDLGTVQQTRRNEQRRNNPYAVDTDDDQPIRLDQTAEDQVAGYNRPEHLRALPEEDPVFIAIQKPLRAAAESANRTIDDHLPRERLHHYGFDRNHLSMLAWQVYRNAQAEAIFTTAQPRSSADPPLPRAS